MIVVDLHVIYLLHAWVTTCMPFYLLRAYLVYIEYGREGYRTTRGIFVIENAGFV